MDIEDLIEDTAKHPPKRAYIKTYTPQEVLKAKPAVLELLTMTFDDLNNFRQILTLLQRKYHTDLSFNKLNFIYKQLLEAQEITANPAFENLIKIKKVRDQQGVIVLTTVMAPNPNGKNLTCNNDCHYCPNVPGITRSYMLGEPAVDRGFQNDWDPIKQVNNRIEQYIGTGIILKNKDEIIKRGIKGYKIEVINEGGTYTTYPKDYRMDYITKLYYACNTFFDNVTRLMLSLAEEKQINETALLRIIGMSIETRPDTLSIPLLQELRIFGVTRVQIGVQHLDDDILRKINRGCYQKDTIQAIRLLFDNGFKIAVHYMPDLPGSSYEQDLEMWELLFSSPSFEFDYVKIYPCMIMPHTMIKKWYEEGTYKPYAFDKVNITINQKILEVPKIVAICLEFMRKIKSHQRLERMLRDLPVRIQIAGCNTTNLRQLILNLMQENQETTQDIRSHEIRDKIIDHTKVKMQIETYAAAGGIEKFINYSDDKDNLIGFLRLRLPDKFDNVSMNELQNCAFIREIHVYGQAATISSGINDDINISSRTSPACSQHMGYGTKMLEKAIEIARENSYRYLSVIAGEGVKGYYRNRGFIDSTYYMYYKL